MIRLLLDILIGCIAFVAIKHFTSHENSKEEKIRKDTNFIENEWNGRIMETIKLGGSKTMIEDYIDINPDYTEAQRRILKRKLTDYFRHEPSEDWKNMMQRVRDTCVGVSHQ